LQWLVENSLKELIDRCEIIRPDKNNNWINMADNDFESLLPLCSKEVKLRRNKEALFELFSLGVATNRDEWVYDYNEDNLMAKVNYFINKYAQEKKRWTTSDKTKKINDFVDREIKWTEELEAHLKKGSNLNFDKANIQTGFYRPFIKKYVYFDRIIIHRPYQQPDIFPIGLNAKCPNILTSIGGRIDYSIFSVDCLPNLAAYSLDAAQCLPLYRYDKNGNRLDNITNWGLEQFTKHYEDDTITKQDIFHYVYAALHNPAYRKKYELNLKREFPRIPFYDGFRKWSAWGKRLMNLHLNYENAEPYPLRIVDNGETKPPVKPRLKADKEASVIILDEQTELRDIPAEAWKYRLGNRSALEWILDQYQEKKPKDPTVAEKFNTYRFADYKEQVIDLLKRVCTVSVETVKIIREIESLK
jgi:predicted helicase